MLFLGITVKNQTCVTSLTAFDTLEWTLETNENSFIRVRSVKGRLLFISILNVTLLSKYIECRLADRKICILHVRYFLIRRQYVWKRHFWIKISLLSFRTLFRRSMLCLRCKYNKNEKVVYFLFKKHVRICRQLD